MNGKVYEEHLIPIPTKKIVKTFKEDGTEDIAKRQEIDITKKNLNKDMRVK